LGVALELRLEPMAIAVACNLELSSFGASVGGYLLEKSWLRRLPVLAQ
jgi:hypothetical protein